MGYVRWCILAWSAGLGTSAWTGFETAEPPSNRLEELPPLYVLSTLIGDLRRVAVAGELDMATVPVLEAVVDDTGRTSPGERRTARSGLVLDLSGLTFLDAAGIAALSRICIVLPHGDDPRVLAPTASGPRRLLRLAVDKAWLPAVFSPAPTCTPSRLFAGAVSEGSGLDESSASMPRSASS